MQQEWNLETSKKTSTAQDILRATASHQNRICYGFVVQVLWLVVSTHLKNISQNGNLPQIGVKIKNV